MERRACCRSTLARQDGDWPDQMAANDAPIWAGTWPVLVTMGVPGFWRGAYAEVRKDMRGEYPHPWPVGVVGGGANGAGEA